jgi:hypothetical protein
MFVVETMYWKVRRRPIGKWFRVVAAAFGFSVCHAEVHWEGKSTIWFAVGRA